MTITLRKAIAGLVAAGALTLAGAVPAVAGEGPTGPGTALCGPSNGSFHAQGGPGYAQYQGPPANPRAYEETCIAH
jgi:hypothetical protein